MESLIVLRKFKPDQSVFISGINGGDTLNEVVKSINNDCISIYVSTKSKIKLSLRKIWTRPLLTFENVDKSWHIDPKRSNANFEGVILGPSIPEVLEKIFEDINLILTIC